MNVRPRRRVTIRDVARVAQVSHQTVSRVINDEASIRPQTRERVLKTIAELGFRPNQIARSLVTRKTNIVGLLISNITNPFFPDIVSGAQSSTRPVAT
jgi:LacI family transcriptional regulator